MRTNTIKSKFLIEIHTILQNYLAKYVYISSFIFLEKHLHICNLLLFVYALPANDMFDYARNKGIK